MIVGFVAPDHRAIARFRKLHPTDLEALFLEILKLCHGAGLVRVGVVSLDGTKVKVNAALSANRTAASLADEVAAMLAEAEAADAEEDKLFGDCRGDELPAELAARSGHLARLQSCHTKLRKLLTRRGRDLYRLRSQSVEPVFGPMKENQRADAFMMRGPEECEGVWALCGAAHTLGKPHFRIRPRAEKRGNAVAQPSDDTPIIHRSA